MRLRRGGEETTPVEILTDDEGWADATPVTTAPERRGRWPEAILVVAVIAVVLGIGATSGSDGDEATDMPRRTTTTVRRPRTTPPTHPAPTTTTWPLEVVGAGSVLGAGTPPTGSALVVAEERSIAVLDLDTGDLCRTEGSQSGGAWFPPNQGMSAEVQLQDNFGRTLLVDRSCDVRPANQGFEGDWAVARTESAVWVMEDGPLQTLVERSHDGEERRRLVLPAYNGSVVDRDWLVLAVAGEMVAIDLHGDRQITLGSGFPMGVGVGNLIAMRCERLECGLVMIDIESGRRRPLDVPMPIQWEPAILSPDGRWLSYTTPGDGDSFAPVLVDLETSTIVDTRGGPCMFTNDSRWLLCVRPSVVEAVSLEDGHVVDMSDLFDRPTNGFTAMRTG